MGELDYSRCNLLSNSPSGVSLSNPSAFLPIQFFYQFYVAII